jgi:hypothetical protein
MFLVNNCLKQEDALSLLLCNFALEYAVSRVQVNQEGLKLNGTHQPLVCGGDANIFGRSLCTMKKNTETSVFASKEIGIEVSTDKAKYMVMSRDKHAGQNHNIRIDNESFERVEQFQYLGAAQKNQNSIQEEIKSRFKSGVACCHVVQSPLLTRVRSKNIKIEIYKSVILYWSETWLLTLNKEPRLRMIENRVLRRIFGPERDDARYGRKLHNSELNYLYSSPNIIQMIKSRSVRWEGHVAYMGKRRGPYRILVGKPGGKRPLGRPRHRWEVDGKMDLQEVEWERHGLD